MIPTAWYITSSFHRQHQTMSQAVFGGLVEQASNITTSTVVFWASNVAGRTVGNYATLGTPMTPHLRSRA